MIKIITKSQFQFLEARFNKLISSPPLSFANLTPSKVPTVPGVYVITALLSGNEQPYYVGRTKNLRQRLYNNHLMGSLTNARLKKHLIDAGECIDKAAAKEFMKCHCQVRWIEQDGFRERGAIEGYTIGLLFPKHGIYEEH